MNKIEVVLGVTALLFSVLSILFINFGVVPSGEYPGHYTYGGSASFSGPLIILLPFVGFVAVGHGIYGKRFLELGLGIIIVLWGFWTLLEVAMFMIDGRNPYIKEFPTSVTETWLSVIPGVFLGIALMLDGMRVRNHSRIDNKTNQKALANSLNMNT